MLDMPAKPLRRQRSRDTRDTILDAALKLFAARGYDGVSVRDIAAELGVNHGLIRYHFGGKEQLWREAVTFLFERCDAEAGEPPEEAGLPLIERFERFLKRYVRYCARHPEHARLMVQESTRDGDRVRWAAENFIRPQHVPVLAGIRALMAEGVMTEIDPVLMIYMISAIAQVPYALAAEVKHTHNICVFDDAVIEAHANAVVRLILRR